MPDESAAGFLAGERLAKIETLQITEIQASKEFRQEVRELIKDHEARLRMLEKSMWKIVGASAAAAALVGTVATVLTVRITE